MIKRANSFYLKLFNEELSITQALIDTFEITLPIYQSDCFSSHFRLCAALMNMLTYYSIEEYSVRYRCKERLDSLMRIYEQKRLLWLQESDKRDIYNDLPLE